MIEIITEADYKDRLAATQNGVLLFFKKLCPHCKNMEKVLEKFGAAKPGIALYGMFIAIVVPPAKENRAVAAVAVVSMAVSAVFSLAPYLREISSGFRIILVTVLVAGAAAWLAPLEDKPAEEESHAA